MVQFVSGNSSTLCTCRSARLKEDHTTFILKFYFKNNSEVQVNDIEMTKLHKIITLIGITIISIIMISF